MSVLVSGLMSVWVSVSVSGSGAACDLREKSPARRVRMRDHIDGLVSYADAHERNGRKVFSPPSSPVAGRSFAGESEGAG